MTTRTYIVILCVLLAMCLDLALQADRAHANFAIPAFDVTTDDVGQEGINNDLNATVDSNGIAHFIWNHSALGLQTRTRAPDGVLGPVQKLGGFGWQMHAGADAAGNAQFVWRDVSVSLILTRRRHADGTLGKTVAVSPPQTSPEDPRIAVEPSGGATVVWKAGMPAIQGRRMAPDGALGPVENISTGSGVSQPQVAVDDNGNAVVAWLGSDGGSGIAAYARRWTADGSLGPVRELTAPGENAGTPRVAFDGAGTAHIAVTSGDALLTRRMGPDGVLEPAKDIRALSDDSAAGPGLAVDNSGNAQVVWRATSPQGGNLIQTRHEFPNGSYGPVQNLAHWDSTGDTYQYVAFDAHGNARHVWTTGIDSKTVVMARTIASEGTLGVPQRLSGTTDPFEGENAWHLRLAGGPNGGPVAVWAHERSDSPALTVQGAAVGIPGDGGGDGGAEGAGAGSSAAGNTGSGTGTGADRVAPALSGLALRPARLTVRRRGRVSFTLSEPAKVVLRVVRRGTGRRVGSIRASGRTDRNSLSFRGRLRRRWLRPGRYAFVAVATDAAGNTSAARRARFQVVTR